MSGMGAKLYGGRWNSVGIPVLYMAGSRALAALEVLAHFTNVQDPESFCITVFEAPDDSIEEVKKHLLPKDWNSYPSPSALKKKGDDFAKKNQSLLLKVPSAIVEDEHNYIMNVNHPLLSKVKIVETKPFLFDKRLC